VIRRYDQANPEAGLFKAALVRDGKEFLFQLWG
jgi:hypothetical protein